MLQRQPKPRPGVDLYTSAGTDEALRACTAGFCVTLKRLSPWSCRFSRPGPLQEHPDTGRQFLPYVGSAV